MTDDDLLGLVAHGDHAAFTELHLRLHPRLLRAALRVVRVPAMAEEVVQEVLAELWVHAARFDPTRGSTTTFVLTMTRRRAIDVVRSEHARRGRQLRLGTRPEPVPEIGERLERQHDVVRVQQAMQVCTALQREALELAFWHGLTYPEVAAVLRIPLPTAKSRLRDGMRRLQRHLLADPGT